MAQVIYEGKNFPTLGEKKKIALTSIVRGVPIFSPKCPTIYHEGKSTFGVRKNWNLKKMRMPLKQCLKGVVFSNEKRSIAIKIYDVD